VSPSLTSAEAKALGRRAAQPMKAPGELLAVWVPGKLVNPLNAGAWGWQKRSRTAKAWKDRTTLAIFEANLWRQSQATFFPGWDHTPKCVLFHASVFHKFDSDGLQAACKPIRDTLIQCGVIHSDAPDSGHEFVYAQMIDRARRGVEIRVSLRPPSRGGA